MPQLWQRTANGQFVAHRIDSREIPTSTHREISIAEDDETNACELGNLRLLSLVDKGRPMHMLLADPGPVSRVNGQRIIGGAKVLKHKDEITFNAQQFFFSAETPPVVVSFPAHLCAEKLRCPVCRGPFASGQPVVQCPGCQRWYHHSEKEGGEQEASEAGSAVAARPCWTYAPQCKFCGHQTAMSEEALWRPDEQAWG
jgi:hypothetical protein